MTAVAGRLAAVRAPVPRRLPAGGNTAPAPRGALPAPASARPGMPGPAHAAAGRGCEAACRAGYGSGEGTGTRAARAARWAMSTTARSAAAAMPSSQK